MRRKKNLDVNEPSTDRWDRQETSGRDGREQRASLFPFPSSAWQPLVRGANAPECMWYILMMFRVDVRTTRPFMGILRSPDHKSYLIDPPNKQTIQTIEDFKRGHLVIYPSAEAAYLAARLLYPEYGV